MVKREDGERLAKVNLQLYSSASHDKKLLLFVLKHGDLRADGLIRRPRLCLSVHVVLPQSFVKKVSSELRRLKKK